MPASLLAVLILSAAIPGLALSDVMDTSNTIPGSNTTFFLGNSAAPQLTEPEGISSCQAALLAFYNTSKQLSELDSSQWQESANDHILCKAGLWGCPRSDMQPAKSACAEKIDGAVSVAIIIMASDNSWKGVPDISVLQQLLAMLDRSEFHVLIHVDQNSSPQFQNSISLLAEQHARVSLVRYPLACSWAGASITAGQLSALADVYYTLQDSCIDLVINLSSSDFPVQDAAVIVRKLAGSIGHVHFDYFPKEGSNDTFHVGPDPSVDPKDADMFYLPECYTRPVSIRRSDLHPHHMHRRHDMLSNWQIVISSQFWILSKVAVEYLVTDQRVAYLWHFMQHTAVTDESFVSTAIYNHPQLNATIMEGAFKYIGRRAQGRLISDADLDNLKTCKYLFARKFMSGPEALRLTNASRAQCVA